MNRILGLDISSATIGWALLVDSNEELCLKDYGYISPPKSKKGSLAFRASKAFEEIESLVRTTSPDIVVIESYANKFPSGRSTARTIIVLSVFNEVCAMAVLKATGKDPVRLPVATIRSKLSKFYKQKVSSKEECFDLIEAQFSDFKIRKNRAGNIAKECFDEADAIAVAAAYYIKEFVGE